MAKRLQDVHINSMLAYYGCPVVYGSVVYSSVVDVQLKTITIYLIAYPVIHY